MKEMIETRNGSIEDPVELDLVLEKLEFEPILDISNQSVNEIKVHDLEISDVHNYVLKSGGVVHNGGGKI